jgi:hypothetical protein
MILWNTYLTFLSFPGMQLLHSSKWQFLCMLMSWSMAAPWVTSGWWLVTRNNKSWFELELSTALPNIPGGVRGWRCSWSLMARVLITQPYIMKPPLKNPKRQGSESFQGWTCGGSWRVPPHDRTGMLLALSRRPEPMHPPSVSLLLSLSWTSKQEKVFIANS